MLAVKIQPPTASHGCHRRRWSLPISEGVTETVHTDARQLRLGTVMLKPDGQSAFRLNKAGLGRISVLAEQILGWNQISDPGCKYSSCVETVNNLAFSRKTHGTHRRDDREKNVTAPAGEPLELVQQDSGRARAAPLPVSRVNTPSQRSVALSPPNFFRRSESSSSILIWLESCRVFFGSKSKPVRPWPTSSGIPPMRDATIGLAWAIASRIEIGLWRPHTCTQID